MNESFSVALEKKIEYKIVEPPHGAFYIPLQGIEGTLVYGDSFIKTEKKESFDDLSQGEVGDILASEKQFEDGDWYTDEDVFDLLK